MRVTAASAERTCTFAMRLCRDPADRKFCSTIHREILSNSFSPHAEALLQPSTLLLDPNRHFDFGLFVARAITRNCSQFESASAQRRDSWAQKW
jgi:hypothetical protein